MLGCKIGFLLVAAVGMCVGSLNAQEPWSPDPELVKKKSERGRGSYVDPGDTTYLDSLSLDRKSISSTLVWNEQRPTVLDTFKSHVYGRFPDSPPEISWSLEISETWEASDTENESSEEIVYERWIMEVSKSGRKIEVPVVLTRSASQSNARTPLIIFLNNRFEPPMPDERAKQEARNKDFWPVPLIVGRGFATASFYHSDVELDRIEDRKRGLRWVSGEESFRGDEPDTHWGAIGAWAFAIHRIIDQAAHWPSIDTSKIAVAGHSRGGKTALWAAATDSRIGHVLSNQSGCGGAALSGRRYGETVKIITTSFPYWFARRFAEYSDREDALPVDQHELIRLIAPRGVSIFSAGDDLWADPRGEYLSLVGASPIYHVFQRASLADPQMPAVDQLKVVGKTAYRVRSGGHNLNREDWEAWLDAIEQIGW
ncbi:MAG: hypothetical protein AAF664_04650 [Planctomycetota bacterium]